jgi:succinate-acetate transporter protein
MSTSQAYSGLNRPGWLTFAAVTLFAVGFLRIISAIYYFSDSARVVNVTNGALGDHLFVWGLWDLIIAVLAISAGFSLLSGNTFGRVIGYLWAINAIVQSFLIIEYAPWFGFGTLLLAMLVIYALSMSSDYRETRAP